MPNDWVPVSSPLRGVQAHRVEIDRAISRVLDSGTYVLGPEVNALEQEFGEYLGVEHVVGVNSGTDALALTLRALGIGAGDEVITASHTAVATVAAIEQAGAAPVLADVDRQTLTLDPDSVREVIGPRTRALVPVHLYGQVADMASLLELARQHGLAVLEDCSQAHGATWRNRPVGSLGDAGLFSSYPTKNLPGVGDAGLIATRDAALAARLRRLRQYGWEQRNWSLEIGFNSRLDEIQAAILRVRLRYLDDEIAARRGHAEEYVARLAGGPASLLAERQETKSAYHIFAIRVAQRRQFIDALDARGIQTAVHYPSPVHVQPAYVGRVRTSASLLETERASSEVLSLPMFPELSSSEIDRVVEAVLSVDVQDVANLGEEG